MYCLLLPPENTMDVVKGHRLESLPRLKCISGTEIFFGLINLLLFVIAIILVIAVSPSTGHFTWSWSLMLNVAFYFLLFSTGCFGVHLVNRDRQGNASSTSFSILAGLNIVLCIIYSIFLLLVIVSGILIAVTSHYIHAVWEQTRPLGFLDKSTFTDSNAHNAQEGLMRTATGTFTVTVVVVLVVTGLFFLLFAVLTGMAAKISRRNAAVMSSSYKDNRLPSMGGTHPQGLPVYGEYHPIKQEI